jgi:hypothetical protein
MPAGRLLYCHCAFARVLPPQTKTAVLAHLAAIDAPFECVPDLCEMSARRDPRLAAFAEGGPLTIVACYERAVRGLFRSAGAPLPAEGVRVLNMRTETAEAIAASIDQIVASADGVDAG